MKSRSGYAIPGGPAPMARKKPRCVGIALSAAPQSALADAVLTHALQYAISDVRTCTHVWAVSWHWRQCLQSPVMLAHLDRFSQVSCHLDPSVSVACSLTRSELPLVHDVLQTALQYAVDNVRAWALLRQVCTQFQHCLDNVGTLDHVHFEVRAGIGRRMDSNLETVAASRCAVGLRRMTLRLQQFLDEDEVMRSLTSFPLLQRLDLHGVTDSRLLALACTTAAETLLSLWVPRANRVTSVGLGCLTRLKLLQDLQLDYLACPRSGETPVDGLVIVLPQLKALQYLSLAECRFLDAAALQALHAAGALSSLHSLDLAGCRLIDDACLLVVSQLAKLSTLCLDRCERITDVGLHALALMAGLQELKMNDLESVTDAGLNALAPLNALKLEVHQCPNTTHGSSHDAQLGLLGHDALRKRGLHVVCHHPGMTQFEASCHTALIWRDFCC